MNSTAKKVRRTVTGLLVVALLGVFAVPSAAVAQQSCFNTPTADQYKSKTICVDTGNGGGNTPGHPPSNVTSGGGGGLPFTGLDVAAMVAVALAVTGLGLALQRAVARQGS